MAGLLERIAGKFGYMPRQALHAHAARLTAARRFDAAVTSRLTATWGTSNQSIDAEIRHDLAALRARSRDLSINNDYGRKFLRMVAANVVGPHGFTLQAQPKRPDGTLDKADSDAVEAAFTAWCRPGECDLTGKLSFVELCNVWIRTVARDGEALVRRVRDPAFRFGYRLQLLDIDRLDPTFHASMDNGNRIRMSIEFDPRGMPVAYHLLTQHPGDYQRGGATVQRERIPAADLWHHFTPERPEQSRGFPWMAASMMRLNMLGGYEEAAIVAARAGASKMGFFVAPDGDPAALANGTENDPAVGDPGAFTTSAEAGTFDVLPQGYDFKAYNPEYPTANYDMFVKACLRGISSGLGVAYNSLANDLEGVNFSSIRAGVLEEREAWMTLQRWAIDAFLTPLYLEWVEMALLKGAIIGAGGTPLPAGKLYKYQMHAWQGRRWPWVDPVKDIEAARLAIQTGIASPQMIAAQAGVDVEDVLIAIGEFEKAVKAGGLTSINIAAAGGGAQFAAMPAPAPAPAAKADATTEMLERAFAPILADIAQMRRDLAEARKQAPAAPQVFHIAAPTIDARSTVNVPPAEIHVAAPEVRIDNHVEPTPVTLEATVESPIVHVKNDVTVEQAPVEVSVQLPDRKTETVIERDAAGDIVRATQRETSVH